MCNICFKLIKKQFVNPIIHQSPLFVAMDTLKCPAMKALEDLTPSGSEFVEDPQYCFEHVRRRLHDMQDLLIEKQKTINKLRKGEA